MKKAINKWLSWLISPMAIGFLVTFTIVWLTIVHYNIAERGPGESRQNPVIDFFLNFHQWSIDHRLRVRGPRTVSSNIALLTVDEKALATLGRWPWSRETIARAIDRAFADGARVAAFDMVFSEPQLNPAETVLQQNQIKIPQDTQATLKQIAEHFDADRSLGQAINRHSDKIVAGAFNDVIRSGVMPPETEFCRDLIYKRSSAFKAWDKEEVLLSVTDPFQPYIPQALVQVIGDFLSEKEKEVRSKYGKTNSKIEEVVLNQDLAENLHETCINIFDTLGEGLSEAWPQIVAQENPNEFRFASFEEWLSDFKAKVQPSAIPYSDDWVMNTPAISTGTKHTGFFNTEQDSDGTIRSKSMLGRTGNFYFPALSLKAFLVANGFNANPRFDYSGVTRNKEVAEIDITNNETGDSVFRIPTDGRGKLLINYAGPSKMFPYLSFADLMSNSKEIEISQRVQDPRTKRWSVENRKVSRADFIKDKIFIVGATATGIYDLRVSPFAENFPGAEIHLNVLDNLIQRNFLRTVPDEPVIMMQALLAIGFLVTLALSLLGAIWGSAISLAMIVAIYLVDRYYFFANGIVITVIWPLFLVSSLYVILTFYRYFTEERGKKELRKTFQKYVSPAIVDEILAHPENIQLGGRKTHLTVFFSDVRGFTTISEKLDPRALSDLLNEYLTPMTDLVFKNRGTLDKYMGDAIMAFFGAPVAYPDHAKYACRCALQTLEKLFQLQKEFERRGLPSIDIGIGLNTGDVSVGNMGSETVRSYTVMGDAVNLASRLEGINKEYGTRIIISENTYKEVKDSFICREVDWVRVKGKLLPVKIYELIAEGRAPNAVVAENLRWFQDGYDSYHLKAWQKGLESFSKALDANPTDEVSKLYIERCQDYILNPPPEDWDGVFVMKTK